eukprot:8742605-Pyramimonas_sp.AAC.1
MFLSSNAHRDIGAAVSGHPKAEPPWVGTQQNSFLCPPDFSLDLCVPHSLTHSLTSFERIHSLVLGLTRQCSFLSQPHSSHSDLLILICDHIQTDAHFLAHTQTRSNSDSLPPRPVRIQTHSHSNSPAFRLIHIYATSHPGSFIYRSVFATFKLRLTHTQTHSHSDPLALGLARTQTHSYSDPLIVTVAISRLIHTQ